MRSPGERRWLGMMNRGQFLARFTGALAAVGLWPKALEAEPDGITELGFADDGYPLPIITDGDEPVGTYNAWTDYYSVRGGHCGSLFVTAERVGSDHKRVKIKAVYDGPMRCMRIGEHHFTESPCEAEFGDDVGSVLVRVQPYGESLPGVWEHNSVVHLGELWRARP